MEKYAVRNIRLCTKDCLCLFVCPTGATDTENSIIDVEKCIGCGACAEACPIPPRKEDTVVVAMNRLSAKKADEEAAARKISESTDKDGLYRLMKAVEKSIRLSNADVLRESGYLLPQGDEAVALLKDWLWNPPTPDFLKEIAEKLAELMGVNS